MYRFVVTGGSSGLGKEIVTHLQASGKDVTDWSKETGVDLSDPSSIEKAAKEIKGPLDALINCAGVNYIDWIPNLTEEHWDYVMNVNAKAIWLTTRALLDYLQGNTIVNIVSNAAHIPMTHSLFYNASKAAALMMTRQMHRELFRTMRITVFSVSPNRMSGTRMSEYIDQRVGELRFWSPEKVRKYQLASLPSGEETDPSVVAEFICFLLENKRRHKYLGGCDIQYGA